MTDNYKDQSEEDLYDGMTAEEWNEMVLEAQREALERDRKQKKNHQPKRPFPKWTFWIIAIAMFINVLAIFPETLSLPVIDFLKTSAKLSLQEDIKKYKESVVVIETSNSRGTGFSFSSEGTILTNHHIVEDSDEVTIAFKKEGLFTGEVTERYPEIDLAVVHVGKKNMPFLSLAKNYTFQDKEEIRFIGNPLRFQGIANEGIVLDFVTLKNWQEPVVMLDAPIYRGNSGSPIINEAGEVIGIIFATLQTDTYGKVGLFVPIDYFYKYRGRDLGG